MVHFYVQGFWDCYMETYSFFFFGGGGIFGNCFLQTQSVIFHTALVIEIGPHSAAVNCLFSKKCFRQCRYAAGRARQSI